MKLVITTMLLCGGLALASPAGAATSVDCNGADGVAKWKCDKKYHLAKLKTKEFRGRCFIDGKYYDLPGENRQTCSSGSSAVTCTRSQNIDVTSRHYTSCSCTNWDSFKGKTAKVKIECVKK